VACGESGRDSTGWTVTQEWSSSRIRREGVGDMVFRGLLGSYAGF